MVLFKVCLSLLLCPPQCEVLTLTKPHGEFMTQDSSCIPQISLQIDPSLREYRHAINHLDESMRKEKSHTSVFVGLCLTHKT